MNTDPQMFPDVVAGQAGRMSPSAALRDRLARETWMQVIRAGWKNYTIVNLQPFELVVQMGYVGRIVIPARKPNELFATKVLNQPRLVPDDMGDDKVRHIVIYPRDIAEALLNEYAGEGLEPEHRTGGVFIFEGEQRPADFEDQLIRASDEQVDWFKRIYNKAEEYHADGKMKGYINERHRDAARDLFRLGIIGKLPTWVTPSKTENPETACEACGALMKKVAKVCPNCKFIPADHLEWARVTMPALYRAQMGEDKPTLIQGSGGVGGVVIDVDEDPVEKPLPGPASKGPKAK